ncbi:MAG: AsmA-like C-terminal region-containing protein, partial [Nitrospirota bacterium]
PISLSLSLHPTLVLEDVHIANPSWASRPDLLHATRLEVQLALLAALMQEVVIDKVLFDGVDLLLEEGPHESNNWTFGTPSGPSASSQTESRISGTINEEGFVGIQRVTIAYQPHLASSPELQVTIIEGMVLPEEDRTRDISLRGTFRDTPFTIEIIVGKILDLWDLTEPWPIDGVLVAADTTLKAKGQLKAFHNDPYLEIAGSLSGEDLSSLNPLFQADLPSYGPYELITSLSLSENTLSFENSRLKIGQTDLSGLFVMDFKEDRTHYYSRLTGETLQTKDFQSSEPENNPAHTSPPSQESFAKQIGIADIDIDLELAVNNFLIDTQSFGKIALSAKLQEGLLRVAPFRAETFGGVIAGSLELDGNHPAPRVTVEVMAQDWDYGLALQAFDVTSEIAGSTDLDITMSGQGASLQEFLDHTTLSINAEPSSLIVGNEENSDKMVVDINQATVKVVQGGAVKARVRGAFMEKALDVALVTGSLTQLRTPDKPWPISLLARSEGASLTIKGGLKSEAEGMRAALAVSLSGQQLNRLDPDLPPSGPYVFRAQLINSGSEYFLKDLKGRLGQSDVTGFVSLNMEEDIPHLSAAFSSSYLDMADLSTPGDITIPVESLQDLGADFTWKVKRLIDENVKLGDLTVEGTLKNGRLAFTTLQGNFFDRKHTYAEFQGELVLDTTAAIPTVSGKTAIQNLNYGHLLKRFGGNGQLVGVANLDAQFSTKGNTLFTMLTQPTFTIGTQDLRIPLHDQQDERETLLNVTQAALSSRGGGPLTFSAEGSFREMPFTITSSSGDLRQLIKEIPQWPLAMAVNFPQLSIDLKGHLLFPLNSEDFSFQVSVKG